MAGEFKAVRSEIATQISDLKADLTWRFVALTAFLGTILSVVNILAA